MIICKSEENILLMYARQLNQKGIDWLLEDAELLTKSDKYRETPLHKSKRTKVVPFNGNSRINATETHERRRRR